MASLLHADLPSEDEEDDSYDPLADKTGEPQDRPGGDRPKRNAAQNVSRYAVHCLHAAER